MNEELPPLQSMLGARVGVHWDWRTSPVGLTKESVSLRGRPKTICAGEMLQSGSGVLRSCSMARRNRHPPGQQSGMPEGQLQCCWRRK